MTRHPETRGDTSVLIVGAGPIGLAASILLDQQGVSSVVIDKKAVFDDHPRARFMDSCTLELFRQLGIAKQVEATGLGPDWTEVITCAESIAGKQIARIPSPEFHSVPRPITPQVPVMTCQDLLEPILYERAKGCDQVEVRLGQELVELTQDASGCRARIRNAATGEESESAASFVIGADGVRSAVREAIGAKLQGEVRDTFFRDVLFHADLSPWIDALGRKAALLFVAHPLGAGTFQPLDGKKRFRIQIGGLPPDDEIDDEFCKKWLWSAVGAGEQFDIEILTQRMWRVSARASSAFSNGRVFLAGDAAQVFTPTGGMGMNCAFAGIRNLAWKLAYVVQGASPVSLLETYEREWRPQSLRRSQAALENADYIMEVFRAYVLGGDLYKALHDVKQYTHYAGTIFGYEIESDLCEKDPAEPPRVADEGMDYVPVLRSGRRAPHIWLDEGRGVSILDSFGRDYVVVLGEDADEASWAKAVEAIRSKGFQIRVEHCPDERAIGTPYEGERAIVVRPDLIVAGHVARSEAVAPGEFLEQILPLAG